MSIANIIRMAVYNCVCRKSTSIQVIIGLTISFILYVCVFGYIDMLQEKLTHTVQAYSSSNCVSVNDVDYEKSSEMIEYISEKYRISEIKRYSMPYMSDEFIESSFDEGIMPGLAASVLVADGKEYKFSEGIGNLYELNSYIAIGIYDEQYSVITDYEFTEYNSENGRDNPLMYGNIPDNTGDIILPECYAEAYNVPPHELVGKNITIKLVGECSERVLIANCMVSGILYNDYFSLSLSGVPSIMINQPLSTDDTVSVNFYPYNFSDISKISEELTLKYEIDAEMPEAFAVYEYLSKQIVFADKVMLITAYMIILAMLLNVLRIIIYSFRKRMKYLGMLRAVGMRDYCIIMINLAEIIIETLMSAVIAILFSSLVMKYILSYVAEITGTSLDYSIFSASVVIRLAVLSFVFWMTAIATIFCILKRNTAIELTKR